MKTLEHKVFDKLNDRDPDLLAEIIAEIDQEEKTKLPNEQDELLNNSEK